jgi:TonB family protein
MGFIKASRASALLLGFLYALSGAAQGSSVGFQLAGLALHQETGRNIYLGGLYVDEGLSRPYDYTSDNDPRIMEYRVVARRTSIRSMLGGMLLQSEVATGQAPGPATAALANEIISAVDGSLYTGDTLQIVLNAEGGTAAYLNGHEMARGDDPAVARYLMMGWVGERGPTTAFRASILADDIDPSLLSTLQATTYSAQRDAQVAAWATPIVQKQIPETKATDEPTAQEQAVAPAMAEVALATPPTLEKIETRAEAVLQLPVPAEPQPPVADPGLSADQVSGIQVASLLPTSSVITDTSDDVDSMDIKLYSQRLSVFHNQLVSKVYRQIRYPRRAVRRELQGRLELDLTLRENGELLQVAVVQSSGHGILDDAAVAAAEKAFKDGAMDYVDPVAIAEFTNMDSGNLVIPVPVAFMLTQ